MFSEKNQYTDHIKYVNHLYSLVFNFLNKAGTRIAEGILELNPCGQNSRSKTNEERKSLPGKNSAETKARAQNSKRATMKIMTGKIKKKTRNAEKNEQTTQTPDRHQR